MHRDEKITTVTFGDDGNNGQVRNKHKHAEKIKIKSTTHTHTMTEPETRIVAALERKWHITPNQTQPGASGCNALQAHRKNTYIQKNYVRIQHTWLYTNYTRAHRQHHATRDKLNILLGMFCNAMVFWATSQKQKTFVKETVSLNMLKESIYSTVNLNKIKRLSVFSLVRVLPQKAVL